MGSRLLGVAHRAAYAARRERGGPLRRAAGLLAGMAVAAAGCVGEPSATLCPTGVYCPAGTRCALNEAKCLLDECGDGVRQAGEACDDGNIDSDDGCRADCQSNETCGNGIRDTGEVCDLGDRIDGNVVDGRRCSHDCLSEEVCGDGILNTATGEECDQGPRDTATCLGPDDHGGAGCRISLHGDGVVNLAAREQCDGTNGADCRSPRCNADCTESVHGDGKVNPEHASVLGVPEPEECDGDGLGHATGSCRSAACNANCTWSECGDGIVNDTEVDGRRVEECDDGNDSDADACVAGCLAARCGDGHAGPGEQCDLGSANADGEHCPYGLTSCAGCSTACLVTAPAPHFCGDGVADAGHEACDLGARNGDPRCPYGATFCEGCTTSCTVVPAAAMTARYCGDGAPDAGDGEACDAAASFACGTCSRGTCQPVTPPRAASGRVTIRIPVAIEDGDRLIFRDGLGEPMTLQFFTNQSSCDPAARLECVDGRGGANAIAARIRTVVEGDASVTPPIPPWPLAIERDLAPVPPAALNEVALRNRDLGMGGNVAIAVETQSAAAIDATGMEGGVGCPAGFPCDADRDCVAQVPGSCGGNRRCL